VDKQICKLSVKKATEISPKILKLAAWRGGDRLYLVVCFFLYFI
jgi:hypothetical protein